MIRPITTAPADILATRCKPVDLDRDDWAALVQDLIDTCDAAKGLGLAAPQIGVDARAFVLRGVIPLGVPALVAINPTIIPRGQTVPGVEGCLSIPDERCLVLRHTTLTLRAIDGNGDPFSVELRGMAARAAAHECDHLDGILISSIGQRWRDNAGPAATR